MSPPVQKLLDTPPLQLAVNPKFVPRKVKGGDEPHLPTEREVGEPGDAASDARIAL